MFALYKHKFCFQSIIVFLVAFIVLFFVNIDIGIAIPDASAVAAEGCKEGDGNAGVNNDDAKRMRNEMRTFEHEGGRVNKTVNNVPRMCNVAEQPPEETPGEATAAEASSPMNQVMGGGCPCPGGVNVKIDGCNITAVCGAGAATASIGCPEVRGADPQYPLVKMLSGILVEWNGNGSVTKEYHLNSDGTIDNTADRFIEGNDLSLAASKVGSALYDVNYTVTISSVDLGKDSLFDKGRADHETSKINKLDRNNFNFYFKGDNKHVQVLKPSEIYEAYKNKSNVVQAYLALAGKGFGERPWETYEKFIDAMCDMSRNKSRCIGDLSYKRHKNNGGMEGNVYMGNAQTTVIGVYSEYSSHPCHGATEVSDNGQPAFAIEIESTWCFNFHATYIYHVWDLQEVTDLGPCCKRKALELVCDGVDEDGNLQCHQREYCAEEIHLYEVIYGWNTVGPIDSSGDCSACVTVKGYIGPDGKMHKDPYPLSFYQSQALLMTP